MPLLSVPVMNRTARVLFLTALGCFVAFHFVRFTIFLDPSLSATDNTGWRIWGELPDAFRDFSRVDAEEMVIWSGFLTSSLLLASSPLLVPVLKLSRLAWWLGVLASGVAMLGFGGVIIPVLWVADYAVPGPGAYCLFAAMLLNFTGFFFIRREIPPNPVIETA